eukprot:CAMPEP_0197023152 /NCGR_PEP_ID=MMETSP1384-20130603/3939_1 /TAXON_ID=29189 /ORGANISM="Ammonia sp." /LENGTH=78 /DNA_ID=CAMNT_0042451337 /DNA_START=1280 /DNA_END=1516 /DNA_ORIENTATION=+
MHAAAIRLRGDAVHDERRGKHVGLPGMLMLHVPGTEHEELTDVDLDADDLEEVGRDLYMLIAVPVSDCFECTDVICKL